MKSYNKFLEGMQSGLSLLDKTHKIHSHFGSVNPQKSEKESENLMDVQRIKKLI